MKHESHKGGAHPDGPKSRRGRAGGSAKFHGHRGRSKRVFDYGELRLLILAMIAERPRHGYEIIKEIEDRFEGRYSPSPGVVYPTFSWLEDMGYATIEPDSNGRKLSRITREGEAFLVANRKAADELLVRELPQVRPDDIPRQIVDAMDGLKAALRRRLVGGLTEAEICETAAAISAAADVIGTKR
ncbi:Transcriptional regulator YqjI (plasmid) [Marinibacterium anthonyi]|nr:Transcriptional regulator YqjI [Marinibacterium anthonyi]